MALVGEILVASQSELVNPTQFSWGCVSDGGCTSTSGTRPTDLLHIFGKPRSFVCVNFGDIILACVAIWEDHAKTISGYTSVFGTKAENYKLRRDCFQCHFHTLHCVHEVGRLMS
eukprot:6369837-Amphidinium_carterae.2